MGEAFHQIPIDEESRKCTAFVEEGKGLFELKRMHYGLIGVPSTFQRLMDIYKKRLTYLMLDRNLPSKWCDQVFTYLDDSIIVSQDLNEHLAIIVPGF